MKRIALALLIAAGAAQGATYPYEVAFNEHGYGLTQSATMVGNDQAIGWFIVPPVDTGNYLIQISNAPDSPAMEHHAVITDGTNIIAEQQGYYPSFYVSFPGILKPNSSYLLYVSNVKADGQSSCGGSASCNVTMMVQEDFPAASSSTTPPVATPGLRSTRAKR
jgi:hypothetical protein